MKYSPSTDTVLMSEGGGGRNFFERTTSGAFVRLFTSPNSGDSSSNALGITRGPNGNVYATDYTFAVVYVWRADGTYIGASPLVDGTPYTLIWTGNVPFIVNTASGITVQRGLFIPAEALPGRAGLRKQVQFLTLQNKSGAEIEGPVYLLVDNVTNANLTNASGFTTRTPIGVPYIVVNVGRDNVFSPNEKVTVQVNLTPTSFGTINYSTRFLAGSGTP